MYNNIVITIFMKLYIIEFSECIEDIYMYYPRCVKFYIGAYREMWEDENK